MQFVYLPHGEHGQKTGLDDFIAAGHTVDDLLALAEPTLRPMPPDDTEYTQEQRYAPTPEGIVWNKPLGEGSVPILLTNFVARIAAEIVEDDGAEMRRLFEMQAEKGGSHFGFTMSAQSFGTMNWPTEHLGATAIIFPGSSTREHARTAIQLLSGAPPVRHVNAHLGWRYTAEERWEYIHGAGAIGEEGAVESEVSVGQELGLYGMPEPPEGLAAVEAVRASLSLLGLADQRITVPLVSGVYRSVLGPADHSIHLAGESGVFKSELAALDQQHFGPMMDRLHLPAAWSSTENALEGLAFVAKDALLTIDDFSPRGTPPEVQRLHAKADRVLRAQGNNSARQRMRSDGTLRPPRPPRGLILSTGEDIPHGQSLRARMMVIEVGRNEVDVGQLTLCQAAAREGLLARALAAFVKWLAPRYGVVKDGLRSRAEALRREAMRSAMHRRTPDIVASLAVGWDTLLRFAVDVGAVTEAEADALWPSGWEALGQAAAMQVVHQAASDPVTRYLDLLRSALASGRAHVASTNGGEPDNAKAWGWREYEVGTGDGTRREMRPLGERIGWLDDTDLFLQPDAAYGMAAKMVAGAADGIAISGTTLAKRLNERGILMSTDDARETLKVRRTLEGERRDVLHLSARAIYPSEPDQPDHSDHTAPPRTSANAASDEPTGRVGRVSQGGGDAGEGRCDDDLVEVRA